MAHNVNFGEHPENPLEPRREPARPATILVRTGCFTASTAVLAALRPLPRAIVGDSGYMSYIFYIFLVMIFLFGIWLIVLGWRVSDNFSEYSVVARVSTRVSHIVLVLAFALHQMYGEPIFGIFQLDDLLEGLEGEANDEPNLDTEANTSNNGTVDGTSVWIGGEFGAEIVVGPDEASVNSRYASVTSGGADCLESDAESRETS